MKTEFETLPPAEQAKVREIAESTSLEYGFGEKERAALFEMMGIPLDSSGERHGDV